MQESLVAKITHLIAPVVAEEGVELLDLQMFSQEGRRILRILLDKPGGGVTLGDCERVSHSIEDLLEVDGEIPSRYHLEVSSPGINRPLKKKEHFERVLGQIVRVQTKEPLDNRRNFKGKLKTVDVDSLLVEIDKRDYVIPFEKIEKANLEVF